MDKSSPPVETAEPGTDGGGSEPNGSIAAGARVRIPGECHSRGGESGRILGAESEDSDADTDPLVDDEDREPAVSCCKHTPELTEEQKKRQMEKMWKSLSLELLADRWDMLTTISEEGMVSHGANTHSRRVVFHILQTLLKMSQMTVGFLFMLIVMTYNAWFLACVVGGAGLGYLVFSSDLERLYGNYAERRVRRKLAEAEAARKNSVCPAKDSARKEKMDLLMGEPVKECAC